MNDVAMVSFNRFVFLSFFVSLMQGLISPTFYAEFANEPMGFNCEGTIQTHQQNYLYQNLLVDTNRINTLHTFML